VEKDTWEKEFLEWKKTLYKTADVYAVDFIWVNEGEEAGKSVELTLSQKDNFVILVRYDLDNPPPLIKEIQVEQDYFIARSKPMRILSGIQPTGYLHYGNYFGAVRNWVKLQNDPTNETFYFIADLHALTSNQAGYKTEVQTYIENLVIDLLASGIDPKRSVLFLQSDVPEHSELYVILSMLSPVSWLERNPTYKEKMEEIKGKGRKNP